MKVSVIMTTHNGRKDKCKRAIESIIGQTFEDWELIIVDDASSDGTDEMVKEFKNKKIKYIHREKNFGTDTKPKNEGLLASSGEYIAFLDSDNTYRPDHLAVLTREIEKFPRVDVVYGDRWVIDETEQQPSRVGVASDFDPFLLMRKNYIDTSDVLIKRESLFDVGGFDERYTKFVDWNLWVRMAKAGKTFRRVPVVISNYYLHSEMKSVTNPLTAPQWDAFDTEIVLPYLGKIEEPRVAVFTLTYDRLFYTEKCFESLYETADYPFDHYIVDNGSSDKTPEYLKKLQAKYPERVHFILNKDNKGISIASNQALNAIFNQKDYHTTPLSNDPKVKKYDVIMKVDNDCLFLSHGWLKKMVEIYKSNHNLAMSCYIQGLRDNPGGAPRLAQGMIKGELVGMTRHLGGICHFVDARAYKDFRWDEKSFLHGVQDVELSQYLLTQGFQMCYLENWYASHGIEGTEAQKKDYPDYFERRIAEKQKKYE